MTKDAKNAKRLYQKEWHKAHPEKAKEYNDRYWEKKAAKIAAETDPAAINENK